MAPLATCSETVLYFNYLLHYCHLFNDYDFGNGCRSREDGKRDHSDMAVKRIWSVEKTDEDEGHKPNPFGIETLEVSGG
ncbi:hypothetical protein RRG08_043746 [Elysia crispata]|uniref:Uncharacterized protein n=1 Tax=Elysia crispata TaxID=231223 RepID=A0AAE1DJ47_9GAST|nr:hypothetical protein RRG08_043746 [Elysia crispata]